MLTSRPRILIADDHAMFAEMLRLLLEKTCTVVGVVADGRALVSAAVKLNPDLIVLDLGDHPKAAIDDQVKSGHKEKA